MARQTRNLSFEQAMQRLDQIVAAMESGEIGIEESVARYEEAMTLAGHCRRILDSAEQRIRKIQLDAAGRPEAVPFEAEDGECGENSAEETPGEIRSDDEEQ